MTLQIEYRSAAFPPHYNIPAHGFLPCSTDDLLWAALTVGRKNWHDVWRHGHSSLFEALFRLALIYTAIEEDHGAQRFRRTQAFEAMDPTEKGAVSYFLGMAVCKLFSARLLSTPWLLHYDVYGGQYGAQTQGSLRPDMFGFDAAGSCHSFESKGRSAPPSPADKQRAKSQALSPTSIGGQACQLHIGSFAYFQSRMLKFFWIDPPASEEPIELPEPDEEWRYYYEPALSLADRRKAASRRSDAPFRDVDVTIHPDVLGHLKRGEWRKAREAAIRLKKKLRKEQFNPDGIRVKAGPAWSLSRHSRSD